MSVLQALPYAWKSSPAWLLALTGVLVVQGLVGPAVSMLAGETVGVLSGAGGSAYALIACWAAVFAVDCGTYPLMYLFSSQLNERMTMYMHRVIMDKGLELKRMDLLEDAGLYDRLSVILKEVGARPVNYIVLYTYILRGAVGLLSYVVILWRVSWWIPLLVVASGVPVTKSLERMRQANWVARRDNQGDMRFVEYLTSLPLDRRYAADVRLYRAGGLLGDAFDRHAGRYAATLRRTRIASLAAVVPGLVLGIVGYTLSMFGILCLPGDAVVTVSGGATLVQSFVSMRSTVDGIVQNLSFLGEKAYFFRDVNEFMAIREDWGRGDAAPEGGAASGGDAGSGDADAVDGRAELSRSMGIELRHVWFRYPGGDDYVLRDVSLRVEPGRTLVVCGRNGAGKSTLLGVISGLFLPERGEVLIDGRPLDAGNIDAVRDRMAVMLQHPGIYGFPVEQNVTMRVPGESDRRRVERSLVFAFGDDSRPDADEPLLKEYGGTELSGGQNQRIALARLAYRDASCVLLDEPTAAIDPLREAELFDSISSMCRGRTAVLVTHRLPLAAAADRIIVMQDGRIVESGTLDELRNKDGGIFAQMVAEQERIAL